MSVFTVTPEPLTPEDVQHVTQFQEVLRILYRYFHERDTIKNVETFERLKTELQPYRNYPAITSLFQAIQEVDAQIAKTRHAKSQGNQNNSIAQTTAQLEKLFRGGDVKQAVAASKRLHALLDSSTSGAQDENDFVRNMKNPLHIKNPVFSHATVWFEKFEEDDMRELLRVDPRGKFSFLEIPYRDNNFTFMINFINSLQDSSEPKQMTTGEFNKYMRYKYRNNSNFESLQSKMGSYLQNNRRNLIPQIVELMKEFPEYAEASKHSLDGPTEAYRGYPVVEDAGDQTNEKREYIAVSLSENVARRFALSIGHLEDEEEARSEGYVETYIITPESVLIDTRLFGGIYLEDEVIVHTNKIKRIKVERV